MSSLIRLSGLSKRYSAISLASNVLPTPVGPKKMNVPIGLPASLIPARLRCTALTTVSIASSWPMTLPESFSFILSSLELSDSATLPAGMPVILEMTAAMSSGLTSSEVLLCPKYPRCTIEPASSIASMALSGRHLSVTYLSDSLTQASRASSVYLT